MQVRCAESLANSFSLTRQFPNCLNLKYAHQNKFVLSIMYAYFQPWLEGACWGGLLLLLHQPDVWHPGLFHQELGRSRVRNQRDHEPVDGKARQTRSRSQKGPRRTRHQTAVFFIQVNALIQKNFPLNFQANWLLLPGGWHWCCPKNFLCPRSCGSGTRCWPTRHALISS